MGGGANGFLNDYGNVVLVLSTIAMSCKTDYEGRGVLIEYIL